jgi:hypothetical protein
MRVATERGDLPVEDVVSGDVVLTPDGRRSTVRAVFSTALEGNERTIPYRIRRGAFGERTPYEDVLLSPNHAFFAGAKWRLPVFDEACAPERSYLGRVFRYYHVALEDYAHDKLSCNGLPVDSWEEENSEFTEDDTAVGTATPAAAGSVAVLP